MAIPPDSQQQADVVTEIVREFVDDCLKEYPEKIYKEFHDPNAVSGKETTVVTCHWFATKEIPFVDIDNGHAEMAVMCIKRQVRQDLDWMAFGEGAASSSLMQLTYDITPPVYEVSGSGLGALQIHIEATMQVEVR